VEQVVKHNYIIKLCSYMVEVASNYMFRS